MYVYIVNVYVYMHICIYVYMYICIYIYKLSLGLMIANDLNLINNYMV